MRNSIAYTVTIGLTHWFTGTFIEGVHTKPGDMSPGAKMFHDIMTEMNNGDETIHALRKLVTSTDDTTIYVTTKPMGSKQQWFLTFDPRGKHSKSRNTKQDELNRATFTTDAISDLSFRGFRIRLSTSINAAGDFAAPFVVISGLPDSMMPHGNDAPFCHTSFDCPTVDDKDRQGYVVFVKGAEIRDGEENESREEDDYEYLTREAEITKLYRELVFRPWIRQIRINDYGWDGFGEVPDHLKCISWQDGAGGQLSYLQSESVIQLEKVELKIETCKHSAARSALEQACDVAPIFRELKRLIHAMLDYDIDVNESKWMRYVNERIRGLNMNISGWKLKLLVAVVVILPKCFEAAYTRKNIRCGFLANGMIDSTSKSVPDCIACLETLRTRYFDDSKTMIEKKEHVRSIMKVMLPLYINDGYPKESSYLELDVKMDKNQAGEEVPKPDAITSEGRHRAKPISSPMSRYQRVFAQFLIKEKRHTRIVFSKVQEKKVISDNKECEKVMMEWVTKFKPQIVNPKIHDIDVNTLTKQAGRDYNNISPLTKPLLIAFIKARHPVTIVKSSGNLKFRVPKGNKADCIVECCAISTKEVWEPKYQQLPPAPVVPVRPVQLVVERDIENELDDEGDGVGGI